MSTQYTTQCLLPLTLIFRLVIISSMFVRRSFDVIDVFVKVNNNKPSWCRGQGPFIELRSNGQPVLQKCWHGFQSQIRIFSHNIILSTIPKTFKASCQWGFTRVRDALCPEIASTKTLTQKHPMFVRRYVNASVKTNSFAIDLCWHALSVPEQIHNWKTHY